MRVTKLLKLTFIYSILSSSQLFSQSARDVMEMSHNLKKPESTVVQLQMDLIDKNGHVEEARKFTAWSRKKDGLNSMVLIFSNPASVKNTRYLQCEKKNAENDKWIFIPALKSTRRIAGAEGTKSFMGTDATYDDISLRDIDDDIHEFVSENEEKNGYTCWVVRSTPKDPKSSMYLCRVNWLDKKTHYPVFSEYYDKKGKVLKTLTMEKMTTMTGATGEVYDIPLQEYMKNLQTGHSTRISASNIKLDTEIPERYFTQTFLTTGK